MVVGSSDLPFFSESLRTQARALLVATYSEKYGSMSDGEIADAVLSAQLSADRPLSPRSAEAVREGLARVLPQSRNHQAGPSTAASNAPSQSGLVSEVLQTPIAVEPLGVPAMSADASHRTPAPTMAEYARLRIVEDGPHLGGHQQYMLPLNVALDRSMRRHMRAQLDLIETACLDLCVNQLGLISHFQTLAELMLFGSGMYASAFVNNLVTLVSRNDFPFGVKRAHEKAVRTARLEERPHVANFGYNVNAHGAVMQFRAARSSIGKPGADLLFGADVLRMTFDASRLLCPAYAVDTHPVFHHLFPERVLNLYVEAHRRLSDAHLTQFFLKSLWMRVLRKKHHEPSVGYQVHTDGHSAKAILSSRAVSTFAHELMQLTQLIVEYFKADVVHASSVSFMVCVYHISFWLCVFCSMLKRRLFGR